MLQQSDSLSQNRMLYCWLRRRFVHDTGCFALFLGRIRHPCRLDPGLPADFILLPQHPGIHRPSREQPSEVSLQIRTVTHELPHERKNSHCIGPLRRVFAYFHLPLLLTCPSYAIIWYCVMLANEDTDSQQKASTCSLMVKSADLFDQET